LLGLPDTERDGLVEECRLKLDVKEPVAGNELDWVMEKETVLVCERVPVLENVSSFEKERDAEGDFDGDRLFASEGDPEMDGVPVSNVFDFGELNDWLFVKLTS